METSVQQQIDSIVRVAKLIRPKDKIQHRVNTEFKILNALEGAAPLLEFTKTKFEVSEDDRQKLLDDLDKISPGKEKFMDRKLEAFVSKYMPTRRGSTISEIASEEQTVDDNATVNGDDEENLTTVVDGFSGEIIN